MLSIERLTADLGLAVVDAVEAAVTPVRWVHTTELLDPTPWLSGGELILTTGLQLRTAAAQRDFVRRLAEHGAAGLGFGTGFDHPALPGALRSEAAERGLALFEVPYSMPFIAITERAFAELVSEEYTVLRRGTEIHRRLEGLVLAERGLDELVAAIGSAISGSAAVLDARGELLAGAEIEVDFHAGPAQVAAGTALLPVGTGGDRPQAWLAAAKAGEVGEFERLILQQAVTVVALELMRRRAMRDTERRLAGDVLAEALTGRLDPAELGRRLSPFGIGPIAAVGLFEVANPAGAEPILERVVAERGIGALVAGRESQVCVVFDAGKGDPLDFARAARAALLSEDIAVRAAISRAAPLDSLYRGFHEARCALEATTRANGSGPEIASHRDLGALALLLSIQDGEALGLYCDSLLGPLEADGDYGAELMRSLEAFIEHNGHWESAARVLFCHRHTLRYRIRKIEELTGRDLGRARDRIELWLALQARELVN